MKKIAELKSVLGVVIFSALYLAAALTAAIVTGNGEFLFYFVVVLVLAAFVAMVHLRVVLHTATLWCLSIWGFLHMAGGLLPLPKGWPYHGDSAVFYSLWLIPEVLKYDHAVHAFGFGVTTWICWQGLQAATGQQLRPTLGIMTICVTAGMGFGALNEIVEFFATLIIPETNVGGYLNTSLDLVSNLAGALTAALLIKFFSHSPAETNNTLHPKS